MEPKDRRAVAQQLCDVVSGFYGRGWCLGTSGNFSVRLPEEPFRLLISRSGLDKGLAGPDDWILVDAGGNPIDGEKGKPSAETFLHTTIARQTGARSVLHTHSVPATLVGEHFRRRGGVTIGGYEILKGIRGITTHETELFLPIVDNAQDMRVLWTQVEPLFEQEPAPPGFLIAGHGLYTWGDSIEEAKRHVETLEFLLDCVARRTQFAALEG